MALNPNTNPTMAGRITAPDASYPYGSSKDETAPGAADGTPYFKARADDIFGLQQALLKSASIVPSGNADNVTASQYMQCLVELASGRAFIYDDSGVADAYVLDVQTDQHEPGSLFDGQVLWFIPQNTGTGAATANPFGQGVTNIKLVGGTANPAAGNILAGRLTKLTYRTSPSAHLELDRTGQKITTIVTATNAAWPRQPDTKTIKFTASGAGGGGGGVDGAGAGTGACSSPGGGGGLSEKTTSILDATYNITIGAKGTGGAAGVNPGTTGGNTTVVDNGPGTNVNIAANGGVGGAGRGGSSTPGTGGNSAGGTASGGDRNTQGSPGVPGGTDGAALQGRGLSGCTPLGTGAPTTGNATGNNAVNPGDGGGAVGTTNVATNYAGGNGADGEVIVEEWL